jgi:hypothetical protein
MVFTGPTIDLCLVIVIDQDQEHDQDYDLSVVISSLIIMEYDTGF